MSANHNEEVAQQISKTQSDKESDLERSSGQSVSLTDDKEHNVNVYKKAWGKKLLYIAYGVLVFTAFVETFAGDSTSGLDSYATSHFEAHSLISTSAVVYKITAIISYPLLAKLNEFFGRAEGFGFSILIYTMAYVLYAACHNVETYVCAEIFYAIGRVGYRVFQQVFIADTTSLINRGIWSQFPDAIAAIPSLYIGSIIQQEFIDHSTWRWGYGSFAIVMGVSCIIMTGFMYYLDRKARQGGEFKTIKAWKELPDGPIYKKIFHYLFIKLDLFGGALLTTGFALFFVPLTLTGGKTSYRWHDGKLIAMLVVGFVLFCVFLFWNARIAKYPFVQHQALLKKTTLLACILCALDLCENSSYSTYMKTVLQVSKYTNLAEAVRIDNSKKVCVQIFSIITGLAMKYTRRSKLFVIIGVPILFLGHALIVHFINVNGSVEKNTALLYFANILVGVGRGTYQCALQVIVQGIAGQSGVAMSTAFFLAFNSVGSLIGSCVAAGIWNTVLLRKLHKYLPDESQALAQKVYKSFKVALKYDEGTEIRDAMARAYRETQQLIGWVGLGVIAPMLILMFFVDNIKLTEFKDVYEEEIGDEISLDEKPLDSNVKTEEQPAAKTTKQKLQDLVGW